MDQVKQALVDHQGLSRAHLHTVKLVRSWSSCKALMKPPGDSIFVGLPSEREARRVVYSAGLEWPQVIEP